MIILSATVLIFALVSTLWFGLSFAVLAQGIADGSMRDQAHMIFGVVVAALEALTVAGWLWALFASARANSPMNGPIQAMCGVTAFVQLAIALASVALIGGRLGDEQSRFLLGHAIIAVILAGLVHIARRKRPAVGSE